MSEPKHSEREARPTNGELLKAYNAWRETQDARLDIEVCTDAHDLLHTGYCGGYLDGLLASRASKPVGVDVEALCATAKEYMDVVVRLFELRRDGKPLNERSVMKDDDALTAFNDLNDVGKHLSNLLGVYSPAARKVLGSAADTVSAPIRHTLRMDGHQVQADIDALASLAHPAPQDVIVKGKCYDCGSDPDALCLACRSISTKPVEVGKLVEYLCCNTNLFSNDIEEAAQAILARYHVVEPQQATGGGDE